MSVGLLLVTPSGSVKEGRGNTARSPAGLSRLAQRAEYEQ